MTNRLAVLGDRIYPIGRHNVLTGAAVDDVTMSVVCTNRVVPQATMQLIEAGAAVQGVSAGTADQHVVAGAAEQPVVALKPAQ